MAWFGVVVTAKEIIRKRWTQGITVQAQSIEDGKILWETIGKTLPTFAKIAEEKLHRAAVEVSVDILGVVPDGRVKTFEGLTCPAET